MNINRIENNNYSSNRNFKAKLVVERKLASKLPGLDIFKKIAEQVKSADFIRIRKSVNNRYLPKHDMYVVIAEKNANIKPNKNTPKQHKHFFGLSTKLLDKRTPREDVEVEIMVRGGNGLVSKEEEVEGKLADISVQLERRADLIPNLVSTVKGYAAHEQSVIDSVTKARQNLVNADSAEERELINKFMNKLQRLNYWLMLIKNARVLLYLMI